jgi:hypothetical protein
VFRTAAFAMLKNDPATAQRIMDHGPWGRNSMDPLTKRAEAQDEVEAARLLQGTIFDYSRRLQAGGNTKSPAAVIDRLRPIVYNGATREEITHSGLTSPYAEGIRKQLVKIREAREQGRE